MKTGNNDERLDYLDGLRGFAACWVMIGHSLMATKLDLFLVSYPHYAVDLFMLISGFLMHYHCTMRAEREPIESPRTWAIFWTRRFFRIAPLYYVMLAVAFIVGPRLGILVQNYRHMDKMTQYYDQSWQNILAHYTFVFGDIPRFHLETALPDWSIGLEMQFYAVFPFMAILLSRIGPIKGSAILTGYCFLLLAVIPSFMGSFVLPSFLPLKLTMFLAGILIAESLFCEQRRIIPLVVAAVILCTVPVFEQFGLRSMTIRVTLAAVLALLATHGRLPLPSFLQQAIRKTSAALGSKTGHFIGEMSYGVYLTHALIIPPAMTALRACGWNQVMTTLALLLIVVPVTFALSWILHIGIERHGITLGRRCIERLKTPKTGPQIAEA